MGIGRDKCPARGDQPLFDGDVGADAGGHVVKADAALAGEHPADVLVGGVFLVGAAGIAVKGEEGLGDVLDRQAVVADVLDDVGPAEVPGHPGVDGDVDDLPGPDRAACMPGEDLLDEGRAHSISIPFCFMTRGSKVAKSA